MKILLVTGGAGFIGSNFIRYFLKRNRDYIVVNIDKLTYAANPKNLGELEISPRYHFIKGDICNHELVNYVLRKYKPDFIINFAAESHVDRSINNPSVFGETNVMGTMTLLQGARNIWGKYSYKRNRFIQISTDEVYGSLTNNTGSFTENTNLAPNSPYSASKAGADLLARSFFMTYGVPVIITRCCNNYGPYQNIEKFIPTCITNALKDKPIPIYGRGTNVREWIHVLDHSTGIIRALFYGKPGEVYNIGTGHEMSNLDMARKILKLLGKPDDAIRHVQDRPGHDFRYALDCEKIKRDTYWSSKLSLDDGIKETVEWYKSNRTWWEKE